MQATSFIDFMNTVETPIALGGLVELLNTSQHQCLFVKNEQSAYCYANANFIQLMGLSTLNELCQLSDDELSKDKKEATKYKILDNQVVEEGEPVKVCELISPQYNQPIEKTMEGVLYPLFAPKKRFVLGVVQPTSRLLKLDFDTIFSLNQLELGALLIKRRYLLRMTVGEVWLSKMEVRLLIELVKGSHAGEIAGTLLVKQTTVESYLANIRLKLMVSSKSELIHRVLQEKILEQIII